MAPDAKRELLRHFLAAVAYRARKAILGAPVDFGNFEAGHGVRKPAEILFHMSNVLMHARSFLAPQARAETQIGSWETEVTRLFSLLSELDHLLESGTPLHGRTEEQLLQGPLADAMTHVGQLAMMRRLDGAPLPKESFDEAPIRAGEISLNPIAP